MPHHSHRKIERLGKLVERMHGIVESAFFLAARNYVQAGARFVQQFAGSGLDLIGGDPVKGNVERYREKRVGLAVTLHYYEVSR